MRGVLSTGCHGYDHPPRAVRDVREHGIPVETFRVPGRDGKSIAAYRFGDPALLREGRSQGRTVALSRIRAALLRKHGPRCHIYLETVPEAELQVDHRIPFEIGGDQPDSTSTDGFMLLCASANRAKAWSCQHCPNRAARDATVCASCYRAYPESYSHVATREVRRLDIQWTGEEVADHDVAQRAAALRGEAMPEFVKRVLRRHLATDPEA